MKKLTDISSFVRYGICFNYLEYIQAKVYYEKYLTTGIAWALTNQTDVEIIRRDDGWWMCLSILQYLNTLKMAPKRAECIPVKTPR